jgi:hypothetical protein
MLTNSLFTIQQLELTLATLQLTLLVLTNQNLCSCILNKIEYVLQCPLFVFLVSCWLNLFLFLIFNDGRVALGSWVLARDALHITYKGKLRKGPVCRRVTRVNTSTIW